MNSNYSCIRCPPCLATSWVRQGLRICLGNVCYLLLNLLTFPSHAFCTSISQNIVLKYHLCSVWQILLTRLFTILNGKSLTILKDSWNSQREKRDAKRKLRLVDKIFKNRIKIIFPSWIFHPTWKNYFLLCFPSVFHYYNIFSALL